MPPRYVYWTIIAGGLPTAFRAAEREELQPTFQRLLDKHPDAEMKYFAQGKLWASPEEARAARGQDERGTREFRGRNWRPGGEHQDPRQKFKDEKKAKNQDRRQERFDRKNLPAVDKPVERPLPTRPMDRSNFAPRASSDKKGPPYKKSFDSRSGPSGPPKRDWRDRPPGDKPVGRAFTARPADRPNFAPGASSDKKGPPHGKSFDRRSGPSAPPKREWQARPPEKRPWQERPPGKPGAEARPEREPRRSNEREDPSRPPRPFQGRSRNPPGGHDGGQGGEQGRGQGKGDWRKR